MRFEESGVVPGMLVARAETFVAFEREQPVRMVAWDSTRGLWQVRGGMPPPPTPPRPANPWFLAPWEARWRWFPFGLGLPDRASFEAPTAVACGAPWVGYP